jgi:hypothetical protein
MADYADRWAIRPALLNLNDAEDLDAAAERALRIMGTAQEAAEAERSVLDGTSPDQAIVTLLQDLTRHADEMAASASAVAVWIREHRSAAARTGGA